MRRGVAFCLGVCVSALVACGGSSPGEPANVAPTFDPLTNQILDLNSREQVVTVTGISAGAPAETAQAVTLSASSSNKNLIPDPVVAGSGTARTVTFTPRPNEAGRAIITLRADDNQPQNNLFARAFTVEVLPGALDQKQDLRDTSISMPVGSTSNQKFGQVVTAGIAGQLVQVRLPIPKCIGADLSMEIRGVSGGVPDATVLHSRTFVGDFPAAGPDEFTPFGFVAGPTLTAGMQFAIVLAAIGPTATGAGCAMSPGPTGNSYPAGNLFFDAAPNSPGWVISDRDLAFRTVVRG